MASQNGLALNMTTPHIQRVRFLSSDAIRLPDDGPDRCVELYFEAAEAASDIETTHFVTTPPRAVRQA
jgi:hypothetical protein